jgi:hypothetical protein
MAVRVPGPDRDDGDGRPDGVEQGVGRRGAAAMVRHLQDRDGRDAPGAECRVDVVLRVPREQEPHPRRLSEEDDRRVIDGAAVVRGATRDDPPVRPQDPEPDVVHADQVPRRRRVLGESEAVERVDPGFPPGAGALEARAERAPDGVPAEEAG